MKGTKLTQKPNKNRLRKPARNSGAAGPTDEKRHEEPRGDIALNVLHNNTQDDIKHAIEQHIPAYDWAPPDDPSQIEPRQTQRRNGLSLNESKKAKKKFGDEFGGLDIDAVRSFAGPAENFHHVDPPTHPGDDERLRDAVGALKKTFRKNGAVSSRLQATLRQGAPEPFSDKSAELEALRQAFLKYQKTPLKKAPKLAQVSAPSFREAETFLRLELGFDLIVKKVYELCTAINNGIEAYDNGNGRQNDYKQAKDAYIAYLQNLNNPNPKAKVGALNTAEGLGYGRDLRWVFVDPVIEAVGNYNLITHVTIVGEWAGGSHLSSNSVP